MGSGAVPTHIVLLGVHVFGRPNEDFPDADFYSPMLSSQKMQQHHPSQHPSLSAWAHKILQETIKQPWTVMIWKLMFAYKSAMRWEVDPCFTHL